MNTDHQHTVRSQQLDPNSSHQQYVYASIFESFCAAMITYCYRFTRTYPKQTHYKNKMRWNIVAVISEVAQIGLDRLELLPPRVANFHPTEKKDNC